MMSPRLRVAEEFVRYLETGDTNPHQLPGQLARFGLES